MATGTKAHELRRADRRSTSRTKLREAKEELFNLRFQSATGQLDNNKRLQTVKHGHRAHLHRDARARVRPPDPASRPRALSRGGDA